jgi:hypothetical protein
MPSLTKKKNAMMVDNDIVKGINEMPEMSLSNSLLDESVV